MKPALLAAAISIAASSAVHAQSYSYELIFVPPAGGVNSGINDSGHIVGSNIGSFLYSGGAITSIAVPGAGSNGFRVQDA